MAIFHRIEVRSGRDSRVHFRSTKLFLSSMHTIQGKNATAISKG